MTNETISADVVEALRSIERKVAKAGRQFNYYAGNHAAKGTAEADKKAEVNAEWSIKLARAAERLSEIIAALTKAQPRDDVREALREARAHIVREHVPNGRPDRATDKERILTRIDTALAQTNEQPDTPKKVWVDGGYCMPGYWADAPDTDPWEGNPAREGMSDDWGEQPDTQAPSPDGLADELERCPHGMRHRSATGKYETGVLIPFEMHDRILTRLRSPDYDRGKGDAAEDTARLNWLQSEMFDVRWLSAPGNEMCSPSDEVILQIVSHHMAEPRERVEAENWNENLRAAIDEARALGSNGHGK